MDRLARQDIRKDVARLALKRRAWAEFNLLGKPRRVGNIVQQLLSRWRPRDKNPPFTLREPRGTLKELCPLVIGTSPCVCTSLGPATTHLGRGLGVPRGGTIHPGALSTTCRDPTAVWYLVPLVWRVDPWPNLWKQASLEYISSRAF